MHQNVILINQDVTWKAAKVIMLRKPDRTSYSTSHSYRLIRLLFHLGKGLERIVNYHLMPDLELRWYYHPIILDFKRAITLWRHVIDSKMLSMWHSNVCIRYKRSLWTFRLHREQVHCGSLLRRGWRYTLFGRHSLSL